jgi:hypothetical protein
VTPPESPPPETKAPPRPRHWLWTVLTVLALLLVLTGVVVRIYAHDLLTMFIDSPAGQRLASAGLSKAIKVDGEFAPLQLHGWTIDTDSYTSTGWPGEAIGSLNLYGIQVKVNFDAVWRGAYRFDGATIDHADITLLKPNDALKRPVPKKKPKPWYAYFLPDHFECGPMICPKTQLAFDFQNQHGRIVDAHLQADLIGKDFNYLANSGTLEFPYLPPLHINRLEMLVTRPMITITAAELTSVDPNDPARLNLYGSMGQREDKTIDTTLEVVEMPIAQVLPADLAPLIHGRASGHLVWQRDKTGDKVYSEGEVTLSGASIDDLSVFKQLALLHGNPDLQSFELDQMKVKFRLEDGVFKAEITARSEGKFSLSGTVSYELKTKIADLDLAFTGLPLKIWLPAEFKPRYSGEASSKLRWRGQLNSVKDSTGSVSLNLDGAHIHNPVLLQKLVEKKGLRAPDEIDFKTAQLDFTYQDQTFHLTRADLELPGILDIQATGTLTTPDNTLDAVMTWQDLKLANWLPPELADDIIGKVNGGVKLHVRQWKMKDGTFGGDIQLVQGELRYTSVQSMLARFVKDKRLLDIPLTRASFLWSWNAGALTVDSIDLRGGDDLGVQGNLALSRSGKLSGLLWVGIRPVHLKALLGLGDNVFRRNEAGLRWAQVNLSGTAKEPKQDLSSQLMGQLKHHPLSIFGLGGRLTSWYVGDLFGAADEWKRPDATP